MKKTIIAIVTIFFVLVFGMYASNTKNVSAATDTVTLTTTVLTYLTFSITSGDPVAFGNLTPGTPICSTTESVASVTTNAANGYTIGLHDGSATNSALAQGAVYVPDIDPGTIATPVVWGSVTTAGVGVTLFAADTTKEAAWGTGTTVCDANNKYAAVPETATTGHTAAGFKASADTSTWGWKVDAPNTQKTGDYTGNVTFTATAVLS